MPHHPDLSLLPVGGDFAEQLPLPQPDSTKRSYDAYDADESTKRSYDTNRSYESSSDPAIPRTLVDLDSAEGSFSKLLTTQQAVQFKIPFLTLNAQGKQSVFIQEYSKYREVTQLKGTFRYGIAIRWVISVVELDGNAKFDQANLIAASVELGYAKSSAKFEVIGMQSQKITEAIPAPTDFTVDTYALFSEQLKEIKKLLWAEGTLISPKLLAASPEIISDLR